jgi:hypothetical protein
MPSLHAADPRRLRMTSTKRPRIQVPTTQNGSFQTRDRSRQIPLLAQTRNCTDSHFELAPVTTLPRRTRRLGLACAPHPTVLSLKSCGAESVPRALSRRPPQPTVWSFQYTSVDQPGAAVHSARNNTPQAAIPAGRAPLPSLEELQCVNRFGKRLIRSQSLRKELTAVHATSPPAPDGFETSTGSVHASMAERSE